jgi:ATP-dependent RNA helicase RhlE
MSFAELNLHPECVRVLAQKGITEPTPVQAGAIPPALEGRDVIGIAQTGTGKTLGFGLPALTRLNGSKRRPSRMLVLTPTRELAQQVEASLKPVAQPLGIGTLCLYGGEPIGKQTRALRGKPDIIVATPGRLLDHLRQGNLSFRDLEILVLDEADRMLDMGFLPDIRRILEDMPQNHQTLLFSATFQKEIEKLASTFLTDPVEVRVAVAGTASDLVKQGIYTVETTEKQRLLTKILRDQSAESVLVFMRTKRRTDRVARALKKEGFAVEAIHGDRTQKQRDRAINGFKRGHFKVLVATDVAARGLDVRGISHVVNFDIPNCTDDYIHRIGRTGRANTAGHAITFVSPEDGAMLGSIEKALGKSLPREDWEGSVHIPSHGAPNTEAKRPRSRSRGPQPARPRSRGPVESANARSDSGYEGRPRRSGPQPYAERFAEKGNRRNSSRRNGSRERSPKNQPRMK